MADGPPGTRVRAAQGRPGGPTCSCDLLFELSRRDEVKGILGEFAVRTTVLEALKPELHRTVEPEPADWRLRIEQRGTRPGVATADLDELLAIVRSADSHGYKLLERAGIACGRLRKHIIDHMRQTAVTARPIPGSTEEPPPAVRLARRPRPRTLSQEREPGEATLRTEPVRVSERGAQDSPRASMNEQARQADALRVPGPRQTDEEARLVETMKELEAAQTLQAPCIDAPYEVQAWKDAEAPHELMRPYEPEDPSGSQATDEPEIVDPREPEIVEPHRRRPQRPQRPRRIEAPSRLVPIDGDDLDPLCGRSTELARIADAVLRRAPRAPVLVGPHGSGRTLLACHLARAIRDRPVYRLEAIHYADADDLGRDLDEIAEQGGIAVLDDIDRVSGETAPAFLGALAQAWAAHAPPVLTVLSHEGKARIEAWLPGIGDTLDVLCPEPIEGAAVHEAVKGAAPAILHHHGLELDPGSKLSELTRMAERYLGGLAMPGRALDLLDLACARTAREGRARVSRNTWIDIVCEKSGIPRERIESLGNHALFDLENQLAREVVGHEHVIATLAQLIRRNRAGFTSNRPVATVLLLGPSGVGKTEIAKALCAALFDRTDCMVRLDMSEYSESHAVARIVGAPPGYVGHEQGGALTDPLLEHPHCVVLLDEIEKAHRDVHQLLLQVFDDGRLTDGRGRTVDFRHAVIIMTSNLGTKGVCTDADADGLDEQEVLATTRAAFPIELWNRIEAPFVLQPLTQAEMEKICRRLAKASSERLFREQGIRYSLSEEACEHLVNLAGRDAALGARPLRHLLTREVESVIADAILRERLRAGTQVLVTLRNGKLDLQ